jgi:hypothetical protein
MVAASSVSADGPIRVLMATKGWQAGQPGELAAGGSVPERAAISITGPGELILDCREKGWLSYSCSAPCHVPACGEESAGFTRKRVDKGSTPPQSTVDKFLALLTRESHPPAMLGVRGSENNPNDGVVLAQNGELHLAPALTRVLEGEYCFGLKALDANSASAPSELHLKWDKSDEPEGLVKAPNTTPGVYALEKRKLDSSGACSADREAVPAWILVAPEGNYQNLQTQWKSNRAWFEELSESNPAVVTTMRHAAIAELAESLKK